jgi:hypothetical protein
VTQSKAHSSPLAETQTFKGFFYLMTSKLEKYLSKELYTRFGDLSIRQNYRPAWMEGLELDFYVDEYKIAAEVQGAQHYSFVSFFHKSNEDFDSQKNRDAQKRVICREREIKLIEIFTEKDADIFIIDIVELRNEIEKSKPKYYYQELEAEHLTSRQRRKRIESERVKKQQEESRLRKEYKKQWQAK